MPLLKNPGGRIVEVDTPKEYYEWIGQPGFLPLSPEEEAEFLAKRLEGQNIKEVIKAEQNVYFATISGIGRGDGFGTSSQYLMKELKEQGFKLQTNYDNQKVGFIYHSPYALMRMSTPYRIIYTMFESNKIPDEWSDYLKLADKIIVPSKWCADVFQKAGFYAEVVPLAFNQEIFYPLQRNRGRKDPYTFIHYDSFDVRKGFMEVLTAFDQEFKKDDNVKLILKTNQGAPSLPLMPSQYPKIKVEAGEISHELLRDLLAQADCGVFPSRGEGFGMTPLEMMGTGLPVILPNTSGMAEYFNGNCMIEVISDHDEPAVIAGYRGVDIGTMPVVSIADLRKKMRWAYEHQEEAKAIGAKASQYVKRFTFKQTALKLAEFIKEGLNADVTAKEIDNVLPLEKITDEN